MKGECITPSRSPIVVLYFTNLRLHVHHLDNLSETRILPAVVPAVP